MSFFTSGIAQTNPTKDPSPEPKAEASSTPPATDYDIRWGVKIPLRDKVELNATLYLPKTLGGSAPKTPVVFTLTPYISDSYHARAQLTSRYTAMSSPRSMCAVAEIPAVSSNRLHRNRTTATTWLNGYTVSRLRMDPE
jgi:predicted acyl esterase